MALRIASLLRSTLPLTLIGSFACGDGEVVDVPPVAVVPPSETVTRAPRDTLPAHHPSVGELQIASRGARRLSVEELERTWEAVAGIGEGQVQIPPNLASSLGDPDWLSVTSPSYEPSPLFMKFMVDLGAILCNNLINSDRQRPAPQRVVLRHPEDVDRNLRQLILRFWAVDASAADHPDVDRLRRVFEAGRQGRAGDPGGWLAVCIALSTAPEFLLY